jgi:mannose-6-phosphate isomerase-like protein (cupin superfamily)
MSASGGGRRVVAARDGQRSIVVVDEPLPRTRFETVPGFEATVIWRTPANPSLKWSPPAENPRATSVLPERGGTTLFFVTFPPDSVMREPGFDPLAAGEEYAKLLPGLAELFEREHPGMHTTPTIDYDIVLNGSISVEFDDGHMIELKQGDVLVQHGTRHAWRNRGNEAATVAFVLIGSSGVIETDSR